MFEDICSPNTGTTQNGWILRGKVPLKPKASPTISLIFFGGGRVKF